MENQEVIVEEKNVPVVTETVETPKRKFDVLGLIAMILAIVGVLTFDILFTVAAIIIYVIIAKKEPDKKKRSTFSVVALWVGIIGTGYCALLYLISIVTGFFGVVMSVLSILLNIVQTGNSWASAMNEANSTMVENQDSVVYILEIIKEILGYFFAY